MTKLSRFGLFKHFYAFSQTSSIPNHKKFDFTVSKIIYNQKHNPNFLYQHTKQVCKTISTLFEGLPQNQNLNTHQLRNLTNNVHLSGFSSWKTLRQTSFTINHVLNQVLALKKYQIHQNNLNQILSILSRLNYELQKKSDLSFMESQIFPVTNFALIKFNIDSLKTIEPLSSHSVLFTKFFQQRRDLDEQMMRLAEECVKDQGDKLRNYLISNIIKNGIYQNRWSPEFLQSLRNLLSKEKILQMNLKGLFNAVQLNSPGTNCIEQDKWSLFESNKQELNILTEMRIGKILKQMDYDVQVNQSLFNYEVDSKIASEFIVEYHGIHHYRINTDKPVQTKNSNWKVRALKNRGYKVLVIPFYTWNKLQTVYQKKSWLIENIEKKFFSVPI